MNATRFPLAVVATIALTNLALTNVALADEAEAPAADAPAAVERPIAEEPAKPQAKPTPVPEESEDIDEPRFRGAIAGGGGAEILIGSGDSITAGMGGIDGRLGVQVMDLLGIYAQLHTSLGSFGDLGTGVAFAGITGTVAATLVADFTFIDQIFVGAGAGYGVLNNPHGPVVHIRAGGYPYMDFGEDGIRRKGLMLGLDMRIFVLPDSDVVAVYPMAQIGYEAF